MDDHDRCADRRVRNGTEQLRGDLAHRGPQAAMMSTVG
jgi:hypothetical protein